MNITDLSIGFQKENHCDIFSKDRFINMISIYIYIYIYIYMEKKYIYIQKKNPKLSDDNLCLEAISYLYPMCTTKNDMVLYLCYA